MKRILITGADSYIGTSVERWLKQERFDGMYQVDTVDMRGDGWKKKDFSGYDVVFHVAGIAHQKEKRSDIELYYKINRDLAVETAEKSRNEGVNQFIFLSSMSVYGNSTEYINLKTRPKPSSNYGKAKLQADNIIGKMNQEDFCVSILRPPMVYGQGCKGNYQLLRRAALGTPIFPDIKNQRSMIFIDNLAEYVRRIIEEKKNGVFHPQNLEYVSTNNMVKQIAELHGKNVKFIKFMNPIIRKSQSPLLKKVFGDLIYEFEGEQFCDMITFIDSIRKTEGYDKV